MPKRESPMTSGWGRPRASCKTVAARTSRRWYTVGPAVRQRLWAKKVHLPLEEHTLAAVRRSSATGLPYGDDRWVQSLAKKLGLDLAIRLPADGAKQKRINS